MITVDIQGLDPAKKVGLFEWNVTGIGSNYFRFDGYQTVKNEYPVRKNEKWTVKTDFRGKVYWLPDGSECKIDRIGETVPENGFL